MAETEPECPECGEFFDPNDGTYEPAYDRDVCLSCAYRLGLLD